MHGLYLLWWVQEKDMSAAVVATVLAAGDLALAAFEVPTGWIADRVGHRASLIAGSLVQIAGMLFCWLGEGLPGLVAASLLVALGDGFRSGADQALLYRSCRALEREHDFQRFEALARAVQTIALVLLVIAGGALVQTWGFAVGWAAETALCVAGLALACAMTEPPAASSQAHDDSGPDEPGEASVARRPSYRRSWISTRMAVVMLPAGLIGAAASAGSFLHQTRGGLDATQVTLAVAAFALAEAAGALVAMRLPRVDAHGLAALAAPAVVLVALAAARPDTLVLAAVGLSFLAGVAGPLRAAAIQRLAADEVRARAASLASACDMAISTVVLPLAGLVRSARSRRGG
jgi:MFS family permease